MSLPFVGLLAAQGRADPETGIKRPVRAKWRRQVFGGGFEGLADAAVRAAVHRRGGRWWVCGRDRGGGNSGDYCEQRRGGAG